MGEFMTKPKANDKQIAGKHYKTSIECWDYIVANDIGYLDGNAIKYLTRWRKKNGIEDLRKAQHYLEKLLEVESTRSGSTSVEYPTNVAAMGNTTSFPPIVERLCDVRDVDGEAWHSQPFPSGNLNTMPILRADTDDV